MNYPEAQSLLNEGRRVRRETWNSVYYLYKDICGTIRLKDTRYPHLPGPTWSQSGYDFNADDYVPVKH